MIQFAIYAVMLLLIALSFVALPLLLAGENNQTAVVGDDETNIQLAKRKLAELKAELAAGSLSEAQFNEAKDELELGLYHDLQQGTAKTFGASGGRWLAIPLLFIVPVIALGLYAYLGDFRAFNPEIAKPMAVAGSDTQQPDINAMVAKLEQKMQQSPDNVEGWLMLGRSYKAMKRFNDAVTVLKKALALSGDNADILLQLADALAMAKGGDMSGEVTDLINKALALEPENEMGLWLAGMGKAEHGDYEAAIGFWKKVQSHYTPQDQGYQEVQQMIDEANLRLGKAPAAMPTAPQASAPAATVPVKVRVELADSFKGKVSADDSVLIYAQAVNGPKAPLAAVKRQVKDLPLDLALDDSMAMMPSMTVSSVDHIRITARVSRAGSATPQAGEPTGSTEAQGEQRRQVNVLIDGVVK